MLLGGVQKVSTVVCLLFGGWGRGLHLYDEGYLGGGMLHPSWFCSLPVAWLSRGIVCQQRLPESALLGPPLRPLPGVSLLVGIIFKVSAAGVLRLASFSTCLVVSQQQVFLGWPLFPPALWCLSSRCS